MENNSQSTTLPSHFSPSSLNCYIECPRNYFYKYVAKIKLPMDPIHLTFGSAIHEGIEHFSKAVEVYKKAFQFEDVVHPDESLNAKYLQFITPIHESPETLDKIIKEIKTSEIPEKEKQYLLTYAKFYQLEPMGELMLNRYLEKRDFLHKLYDLDLEGQAELWAAGTLMNPLTEETLPIPMKGKIDRLTNNHKIQEYKTSAQAYDPKDEGFKFQTRLYALWYYSQFKTLPKEVVYFIFIKNFKVLQSESPIQVLNFQVSVEDLAETFEQVKMLLSQIEQGLFNKGRHKPYCDCIQIDKLLLGT